MESSSNVNEFRLETYEFRWTIHNWAVICTNMNLIKIQNFKFETNGSDSHVTTKWMVGFEDGDFEERLGNSAQLYCKFIEMNGSEEYLDVKFFDGLLNSDGSFASKSHIEGSARVGTVLKSDTRFWRFELPRVLQNVANYMNSDGSITIFIRLTMFTPKLVTKMEKFSKISVDNFHKNLEVLLSNSINADLVLVTKDRKQLGAHKAILNVRCAYFKSIVLSGCVENTSDTIKVDDVSEKTMRILLHFWYTGKLLPSWQDNDTIVEFVYAAGKFQITEILDMLNETLGESDSADAPKFCINLLQAVHKLFLRNAEQRLSVQIIKSINNVKSGDELFTQLGIKYRELPETSEPCKVEALKMLNDVLGEEENIDINFGHINLLVLLKKLSLVVLEQRLLQSIVKATNRIKTVEELLVLFGFQEELKSNDRDLLVKVVLHE